MIAPENVDLAKTAMLSLTTDPTFTRIVLAAIDAGRLDLRLGISWLASMVQPDNYLEIGVRRGFSMAVLASARPKATIYGFDMWIKNYVGVKNPGPSFVRGELERVGFKGKVTFVDGNSHRTLPRFFGEKPYSAIDRIRGRAIHAPGQDFDMVLVDGDHSIEGAYQDLMQVMGHIRIGGALVFDDIAPDLSQFDEAGREAIRKELGADPKGLKGLHGVWRAIQLERPNFKYFEFTEDSPGLAFAIRMS
jgi:predicted O-methyltransferase YrrM